MKALEYMKQLERIEAMIHNKQIEKEQWKDIALGITARYDGERVQSSSDPHKRQAAIDKMIDIDREIDSIIDQEIDLKREIISIIERLKTKEYNVLHMLYIQRKTFKEVAAAYEKSQSWAASVHGRALKNVQRILDSE